MNYSLWHDAILVLPATIAALAAFISSLQNRKKIKEVHETVNSGLSKQLANSKDAGNLEGRAELREENIEDAKEKK